MWNEEVEDFPDKEKPYGSESVLRQHPALPMGTQPGFERVEHVVAKVLDPLELLEEANIDVDGPLGRRNACGRCCVGVWAGRRGTGRCR